MSQPVFEPVTKPMSRDDRSPVPVAAPHSIHEHPLKIEKDRAVRFHYTVGEVGQPATESSQGGEPLAILIGHNNIIPGLEKAMEGREAGETFSVDVPAAEAYGERREGLTQRIPKKHFGEQRLQPGMQVVLQTNFGPRAVTIEKVGMSVVDVANKAYFKKIGV